jgi:cell division protein FtsQ
MTIDRTRSASPGVLLIVGLLVAGIAGWVILNSAFFDIRDVRVLGARNVSEERIRGLAAIPHGENLIMLDTAGAAERLRTDPWIKEAVVERDLPATAVISVVERRPGGWLQGLDGVAIIAGDGTILERADTAPLHLPTIGPWPGSLAPGDRIDGLGQALRVTASMPSRLLRQISSAASEGTDVILELRTGGTVLYGTPDQLGVKNDALEDMLRWVLGQGIAVGSIDVRVPSAPSLEPLHGHATTPRVSPA